MKLMISGRAGWCACDWRSYALLRDNVQHFIEAGVPSIRFEALHAIEDAVDHGRRLVDAPRLRGEVLRAWYALRQIALEEAAVSLRSRAILTLSADEPDVRGTVHARQVGWKLPIDGSGNPRVCEAAKPFVMAVLALTEASEDGHVLEIRREGAPPRFMRRAHRDEHSSGMPLGERKAKLTRGLVSVLALALVAGCASATPAPKVPDAPADAQPVTQLERKEQRERAPVVAPPPAWGNKIVRVSSPTTRS